MPEADIYPFLKQGEPARLFPLVSDTSREKRIASILLAIVPMIPSLAGALLGTTGLKIGSRSRIKTFTEIVLAQDDDKKCRPDGLVVVSTGKSNWSALVEVKIGKADLDPDQVQRYATLARDNGIDAVITISNQFVARPDHSPVHVPKALLKKVGLFHWSWMSIVTQCEILNGKGSITNFEQALLLREFLRYLNDDRTGIERFTQMGPNWRDLIQSVTNNVSLKRTSPEVEEAIGCWFEEVRDLGLQLSRHIGQSVETVIERKLKEDPAARMKASIGSLVETYNLSSSYRVPDSAADMEVRADLRSKTFQVSMKVRAPLDKKTTKARLSWLLRMIKADDPRLMVRAHWPGRAPATQCSLSVLRENPEAIQTDNSLLTPHSFEVLLVGETGKRFSGRRTFIEDLETIVPAFYDLVGQHLRAWQPTPPKPILIQTNEPILHDNQSLDETATVVDTL